MTALADTGGPTVPPGTDFIINKICAPAGVTGTFDFYAQTTADPSDEDPEPEGIAFLIASNVPCGTTAFVTNIPDQDWYRITERTAGQGSLIGFAVSFGAPCTNGVVRLTPGEPVNCTVTNTTSRITIIKDTIPPSSTLFTFSDNSQICNVPALEDDGAGNGNQFTCPPIPAGSYVITEANPAPQGYELTNIVCTTTETAEDATTVDVPNRTANIDLDLGESVVCTFTNERVETPRRTPIATPTLTPTQTPTSTSTPVIDRDPPGGLGALFAPRPPTTVPTQAAAAGSAPVVAAVRPPSTGDGGLQ